MEGNVDPKVIAKYLLQYQAQEDNLIRYQLETEKEIERFRHELIGEVENEKHEWVPDKNKYQTCNIKGANFIASHMKLHISRMVSLSNFTKDDDVDTISLYDIQAWIFALCQHKEEFGFKEFVDISIVLATIDKLNVATMKKAVAGWEGERLTHQFQHVESSEKVTQVNDKPKMFGGLLSKNN